MGAYFASPLIRYRSIEGNVIVLDLQTGEYRIFDEVASAMWDALLTETSEERRIDSLTQRFGATRERLSLDLKAFLAELQEKRLLDAQPAAPAPLPSPQSWPAVILPMGAWWSLLRTTRDVAGKGFAHVYSDFARRVKPSATGQSRVAKLAAAVRAFSLAENFFVIASAPNDCLPRSLSLYRFMLMAGLPVDHVIGVRRYPFHAHAWVEYDGRVLFDSLELTRSYVELARM